MPAATDSKILNLERVRSLEFLKDFHREILEIIRTAAAVEGNTTEHCLQQIGRLIKTKLDLYAVTVLLSDDVAREMVVFVRVSDELGEPEAHRRDRIKFEQGLIGRCTRTAKPVVSNDVGRDPDYLKGPLPKTRSEVCVPLKIGTRVIGVLDIQSTQTDRFKGDLVELMEEIALSISLVLENQRLTDDLKRRSESLEDKFAEKVTQLSEHEDRFRLMIDNSAEPILMMDTDGKVGYANIAATALAGREAAQLKDLHMATLFNKGSIHKLFAVLKQVQERKKPRPLQVELINGAGDVRMVELSALPIVEGGRVTGTMITMHDVTERLKIDKLKKNYLKSLEDEVASRIGEIKDTQRAAIFAIATLAEAIDEDTGGHLERIRHYSKALAEDLKHVAKFRDTITEEYAELLFDLSPLHDLGKVGIRDYILLKTGKLTQEEFAVMQQHTEIGAKALRMAGQMINRESIFSIGEMIAHYHHEKWDGSGYPAVPVNGEVRPLRGDEIPLCARIVALADVYDALTSKRPYKQALPHDWAKKKILSESGKHFDPDVVNSFVRIENRFLEIKKQFPDTMPTLGTIFELPERDREGGKPEAAGAPAP